MKRTIHKRDKERRERQLFKKKNGYFRLKKWKMMPYSILFRSITYYPDWYTDVPYTYNGQTRQFLKRNLYHI